MVGTHPSNCPQTHVKVAAKAVKLGADTGCRKQLTSQEQQHAPALPVAVQSGMATVDARHERSDARQTV